jgi:hypothetical protein
LRALCAGRFRLDRDPAADPDDSDPWMATLVGRVGVIYPHGATTLAVETDDGRIARRLAEALGEPPPYLCGERFWTFLFCADRLEQIAPIIQPPRVRSLSPVARERLARAGEGTRFEGAVLRHSGA